MKHYKTAKKIVIFHSANIENKHPKPLKVVISHSANIENTHQQPQKVGSDSEALWVRLQTNSWAECDFLRRGETVKRMTDFLQSKKSE